MERVLIVGRDTEIDSGEQFKVGGDPSDRIARRVYVSTYNMRAKSIALGAQRSLVVSHKLINKPVAW